METKQETAVEKGEDSSDKQTEAPARVLKTKDRTDLFEHLESFLSFFQDRGHNMDRSNGLPLERRMLPPTTVVYSCLFSSF
jgi:hypothetical protein